MVLIDTSVWISLYRQEHTDLGQKMWLLVTENRAALCGQVLVEYLGGFRKEAERRKYAKSFQSFPFFETTRPAYDLAAELLAKHPRLGAGDAIIAATAIHHHRPLWTLDKDFLNLSHDGLEFF